jgi:hypothetical protein
MPEHNSVHNFHVYFDIDGRNTPLTGGPRSREGGFNGEISVRGEGGTIETAVRIRGEALADGELRLYVTPGEAAYMTKDGSAFGDWPESMKIEPYKLDGGGFGFRIVSKR